MNILLENQFLTLEISTKGAEIISLKGKKDNVECIWTGDSKYWGRHAPILFPIVGKVKNNEYTIEDKNYELTQHGFARDCEFLIVEKTTEKALFKISYNKETLKIYPYKFELYVEYLLKGNSAYIKYMVRNVDEGSIYFSIGAHPGFNCPLTKDCEFHDYYFEFEKRENADISLVSKEGLFKREKRSLLKDMERIDITKELFKEDALIFNSLKSCKVALKNIKNNKAIEVSFKGFPYLGLWSKPEGAPFVCIEPWFGHADFEDFNGDFRDKDGVISLKEKDEFICRYSIAIIE